jgi:hypothetical protein
MVAKRGDLMPPRLARIHHHTILAVILAALAWTCGATGQVKPDANGKEQPAPRRICIIVAGTRPEVTFEKRGELYIEVDAPAKSIAPTQLDISGGDKEAKDGESILASLPVNLNELVTLDNYKGGRILRLGLKRPILANGADHAVEVTCDIGESPSPLLIIFPKNPSAGWDAPTVRVLDAAPASLPANAVLCVNLTTGTFGARIGPTTAAIAGGHSKIFALPDAATGPFPFRVDLLLSQGAVTIANSSYQKNPDGPLVLLAVPLFHTAPGNPPVSLQFLPLPPMPSPQPQAQP